MKKNYIVMLSWYLSHNDQVCNFQIVNSIGIPQAVCYLDIVEPDDNYDKNIYRCTYKQARKIKRRIKDIINHPTILSIKEFKKLFGKYYPTDGDETSRYEPSIAANSDMGANNPQHFWAHWDKQK